MFRTLKLVPECFFGVRNPKVTFRKNRNKHIGTKYKDVVKDSVKIILLNTKCIYCVFILGSVCNWKKGDISQFLE